MSLLTITGLSHSFGDHPLYTNAELTLNKGEHMGIVGQNGAGKSTLIKICTGQIIPDAGHVAWQPRITIGYLDQYALSGQDTTMEHFLQSAFRELYEMEEKMNRLYEETALGDLSRLDLAARYQDQLERRDFYSIDTRIAQVSAGLGLTALGLERPLEDMSGGQRAKVILAKLLLEKPDVLLLDEPTNFLDKEHVSWLANYLRELDHAFMVVSHDHAFLEKTATRICDIDNRTLMKYDGTYAEFQKKKTFLREDYTRQYSAQQKQIKKTEEFIRRNIAGRKSQMAKGRRTQLDRMKRMEALEQTDITPDFSFHCLPVTKTEHLVVKHLSVGYDYPVLQDLNFSVTSGQKVVITGFNGVGKSTLLKTLNHGLRALAGSFSFSSQVTAGYFEQDLAWEDSSMTPIQILSSAYPFLVTKKVRQHLNRCGIQSRHAMQEIGTLSGGQQTKVKMCLLTLTPCNFLILDEPTNHLDANAKTSLRTALRGFPGTVLLVSHEEAFYRDWAQRIIQIDNGI